MPPVVFITSTTHVPGMPGADVLQTQPRRRRFIEPVLRKNDPSVTVPLVAQTLALRFHQQSDGAAWSHPDALRLRDDSRRRGALDGGQDDMPGRR